MIWRICVSSLLVFLCWIPIPGQSSCGSIQVLADRHGSPGSVLGFALGGTGDVDADGFADLFIGLPLHRDSTDLVPGAFHVVSGRTGCTLHFREGPVAVSSASSWNFGGAVCRLGDVDGDQVDDFAVGASTATTVGLQSGRVYIYSGAPGVPFNSLDGQAARDHFGASIDLVGDLGGGAGPDLIVGAPGSEGPGQPPHTGYVRVLDALTGALVRLEISPSPGDRFGASVSAAGDIDQDNFPDYVVGAPRASVTLPSARTECGMVYVYSGANSQVIASFAGDADHDLLGFSVAGDGDVNGDGYPDVVAGAPHNDTGLPAGPGYVRVYSGEWIARTSQGLPPMTPQILNTFLGANVDRLGNSVDIPGDMNGDGRADVLAAASWSSGVLPVSGKAYIWSYAASSWSLCFSVEGDQAWSKLGWAAAGVGDTNGDSVPEVLVGAPNFDLAGTVVGKALVVGTPGPATSPYPGTGEDFILTTVVNQDCDPSAHVKFANQGDVLAVGFTSPGGTFVLDPPWLFAEVFSTATGPTVFPTLPFVHVNPLSSQFYSVYGMSPWQLLLPPQGVLLSGLVIPSGLSGQSIMLQAIVSPTTSAVNGAFAITDGHEIIIP